MGVKSPTVRDGGDSDSWATGVDKSCGGGCWDGGGCQVVASGRVGVAPGRVVVTYGRVVVAPGRVVVTYGRVVVTDGRVVVASGRA